MIDLLQYGFGPERMEEDDQRLPARITAAHRERFELVCRHGAVYGRVKAASYLGERATESYPTAGDFVTIQYNPVGDSVIMTTRERKSFFLRRAAGPTGGEQAVAANFEYVLIMSSLNRDFNPKRLERYLSASWQSGATPVVVLTKADLVDDPEPMLAEARAVAAGVDAFAVSARTGQGLDAVFALLRPGITAALLGSSGVGKSSLINALAGTEIMPVQDVREDDDRGRHTTTHRQLIPLACGAVAIDTPGMRELGMWDAEEGVRAAFDDVEALAAQCRFSDCTHGGEPGCAVRAAIERGELSEDRLRSHRRLIREALRDADRVAFMREKQARNKAIAMLNHARKHK